MYLSQFFQLNCLATLFYQLFPVAQKIYDTNKTLSVVYTYTLWLHCSMTKVIKMTASSAKKKYIYPTWSICLVGLQATHYLR